jgi:hypothetical protein
MPDSRSFRSAGRPGTTVPRTRSGSWATRLSKSISCVVPILGMASYVAWYSGNTPPTVASTVAATVKPTSSGA